MRLLHFSVLLFLVSLGLLTLANAAEQTPETGFSPKLHPWGKFEPGAWKVVRVTTEALNTQGQAISTSITDTQTTLVEIDSEGITLEIEACLDVVGKHFEAEPQIIKQGFHGEPVSPNTKIHEPMEGQVEIDGKMIPCSVQQIESSGANGKVVTTLHYSTTVAPYIFKRACVVTDPAGKTVTEMTMDVTSLEMPDEVLGEFKSSYSVRIIQNTPNKGTITTLAFISPEIPGGVIRQSSKEVDKNGRVVRHSTLKLLAYSTDPDQDRNLFKSNKRKERHRAKSSAR